MISLINQASKVKSSIIVLLLGLLVPFSVFLGDFLNVLYVVFRLTTVAPILFIVFRLIGIFTAGFFLAILLRKTSLNQGSQDTAEKKPGGNSSFFVIVMNFFFSILLLEIVKFLLSSQNNTPFSANTVITLILLLLVILLNVLFITVSWFISESPTGISRYPGAILCGLQHCFRRPAYLITMMLLWSASIAAVLLIYLILWKLISGSSMSALLSAFYLGAMICCIIGTALIFSLKLAKITFSDVIHSAQESTGKGNVVFGGILILLLFSVTIFGFIPRTGNALDQINSSIITCVERAEQYRNKDNLYLCGAEYKKAFALNQALQSYLSNLELYLDKNLSDEKKIELTNLSNQAMATAYEFYPNSSDILYLDGMRSMNSANIADAILKIEKAKGIKPVFGEANPELLDLYIQNQEKPKTGVVIDTIIESGSLLQTSALDKISMTASKKLLEQYTEKGKIYMESITAIAMDYYENQLYPEAMTLLTTIQKYSPDAIDVNYLIAMTDLEIKTDGKRYDVAIEACRKILALYPEEAWAKDLLTGVTIRAGNQEAMDQTIQTAYQENPDNLDTAEQYAYSLLRKTGSYDFTETDKMAEIVIDENLKKAEDRWFSYYCKALLDLKKRSFETSVSAFEKFSDLIESDESLLAQYDEMYNQYILKYAYFLKYNTPAASEFMQTKETTNPYLYQYVYGAYYWSIKDFENGKKHMEAAVDLRPELSKSYFLLGDLYFEEGFRKKNNDYYLSAETNYKKALSIFQEDPFAWFSLGHVLKNMNRYEEALGAFQKTLTYMPAEDHASDHFGVSVHAAAQVQELKAVLDKKGVK